MIADFIKLSIALFIAFIAWIVFQKTQWHQDYTKYDAPIVNLNPLDTTFQQHIQPRMFVDGLVIKDDNLKSPQDIAVSSSGFMYSGLIDGRVVQITPQGNISTLIDHKETGQILGIIITNNDKQLYYVTQHKGLVHLNIDSKKYQSLVDSYNGKKLGAVNNLCIDEDNHIIYFTQSTPISMRFSNKEVLLKHKKGRIFSFNLVTKQIDLVLENLAFPNGIVYQSKTKSIIFSQLNRHQIDRYYVEGQFKGKRQTILSNLFGYGDNLKLNQNGDLFIGIPATRDPYLQFIYQKPQIRKYLLYLPQRFVYALATKRAGGIRVNTTTGKIQEYIFGATFKINFVTTILQKNGKRYFSSLKSNIVVINSTSLAQNSAAQGQL